VEGGYNAHDCEHRCGGGSGSGGWDQWKRDAVRVIVSPNVIEGRGEGGIGAVEGELILSACVQSAYYIRIRGGGHTC